MLEDLDRIRDESLNRVMHSYVQTIKSLYNNVARDSMHLTIENKIAVEENMRKNEIMLERIQETIEMCNKILKNLVSK
jgi:hypothetical protein